MIPVHFRAPESLVERLDALAAERGVERSRLIRQLCEVGLRDRPAPLTEALSEEQLISILTEKARSGHVSAIRTLLARQEREDPRERMLAEFKRMAEERRQ